MSYKPELPPHNPEKGGFYSDPLISGSIEADGIAPEAVPANNNEASPELNVLTLPEDLEKEENPDSDEEKKVLAPLSPEMIRAASEKVKRDSKAIEQRDTLGISANLAIGTEGSGEAESFIRELSVKTIKEAMPDISDEEATKRVAEAEKFFKTLSIEGVGVEVSENELKTIKRLVVEPILRGHLSAESLHELAKTVKIISPQKAKELSRELGYEADCFSDCAGNITIVKDLIAPGYKLANGSHLDLRHMIAHEVAHTAIDDRLNMTPQDDTELQSQKEALALSTEVLELAKFARGKRIPQLQHVETVLDGIMGLRKRHESADPPSPDSFEKRHARELAIANREILTDYAALYLQSDGTMGSFMALLQNNIRSEYYYGYLFPDIDSADKDEEIQKRAHEITTNMSEVVAGDDPRFSKFREGYGLWKRFFDFASKNINDPEIKKAAERRKESGDDDYESYGGGYADSSSSFPANSRNTGSGGREQTIIDAVGGSLSAFADGVNILDSVSH